MANFKKYLPPRIHPESCLRYCICYELYGTSKCGHYHFVSLNPDVFDYLPPFYRSYIVSHCDRFSINYNLFYDE